MKNSKNSTNTSSAKQSSPKTSTAVTTSFRGKEIRWNIIRYKVNVVDHKGIMRTNIGICYADFSNDGHLIMLPSTGLASEKDSDRVISVPKSDSLKAQYRAMNAPAWKLRKEVDKQANGKSWADFSTDIGAMTKARMTAQGDGSKVKVISARYVTIDRNTPNLKVRDTRCLDALEAYYTALYRAEAKRLKGEQPKAEKQSA